MARGQRLTCRFDVAIVCFMTLRSLPYTFRRDFLLALACFGAIACGADPVSNSIPSPRSEVALECPSCTVVPVSAEFQDAMAYAISQIQSLCSESGYDIVLLNAAVWPIEGWAFNPATGSGSMGTSSGSSMWVNAERSVEEMARTMLHEAVHLATGSTDEGLVNTEVNNCWHSST
jgi:hypothetical protein